MSFLQEPRLIEETTNNYQPNQAKQYHKENKPVLQIKLSHGYTLCVADDNLALMTPYVLLEQEAWFEDEVNILPELAPPGSVLVDIGANHGIYTLALAQRAALCGGRVIAFEPNPGLHPGLEASLAANQLAHLVKLRHEGLSREPGQAQFHIPLNPELASLSPVAGARQVDVELTTLDALADALDPDERLGLLKIDAEGAELDILAGGKHALEKHRPIAMFEIKHGTSFNHGLAEAFVAQDYELFRVLPGFDLLLPWKPGEALDGYQLNLIACPPGEVIRLEQAGLLLSQTQARKLANTASEQEKAECETDADLLQRCLHAQADLLSPQQQATAMLLAKALDLQSGTANQRYVWALAARTALLKLVQHDSCGMEWRLALARIEQMLGERVSALRHIDLALRQLAQLSDPKILVSPHPGFDGQPVDKSRVDWLRCALHESRVKLMRYSGYFGDDISQLIAIHAMPEHSLEIERRLALSLLRAGKKITILPTSALCSDKHLNSKIWQRISQGEYRVDAPGNLPAFHWPTDSPAQEDDLPEGLWLHVGGKEAKPGWQMLNITPGPGVDKVGDIRNLSHLETASCARVYASHVLEHVHQNEVPGVLKGFARLLKPGGQLAISVPDMDTLSRHYLDTRLTAAQRHHVMRMMFGDQTDAHDFHYVGFNFELLSGLLKAAGFDLVQRVARFGLFEDTSNYAPYGQLISLNLIARKAIAGNEIAQSKQKLPPPPPE